MGFTPAELCMILDALQEYRIISGPEAEEKPKFKENLDVLIEKINRLIPHRF